MGGLMNHQEVIHAIRKEWNNLYHNASMLHLDFCIEDERELAAFDRCMEQRVHLGLLSLRAVVAGTFRFNLTFAQYGRGGATIAPSEWTRSCSMDWPHRFRFEDVLDDIGSGASGYYHDLRVLRCLQWVNGEVSVQVNSTEAWWEHEKKELDLDFTEPDPFGNTMYVVVDLACKAGNKPREHHVFSYGGRYTIGTMRDAAERLDDILTRRRYARSSVAIYKLERVPDELVDEALDRVEDMCPRCEEFTSKAMIEEHGCCDGCLERSLGGMP
jgi:hypothetical protein